MTSVMHADVQTFRERVHALRVAVSDWNPEKTEKAWEQLEPFLSCVSPGELTEAVAAERERCAVVADEVRGKWNQAVLDRREALGNHIDVSDCRYRAHGADEAARAIRAGGEKNTTSWKDVCREKNGPDVCHTDDACKSCKDAAKGK